MSRRSARWRPIIEQAAAKNGVLANLVDRAGTSVMGHRHGHGRDNHDDHGVPTEQGPTIGLHGQLIIGEGPIYLSPFPMFMSEPTHGWRRVPAVGAAVVRGGLADDDSRR